MLSLKSHLF